MGEEIFEPGTKRAIQRDQLEPGQGIDAPRMVPQLQPPTQGAPYENANTILTPEDKGEVHEI
jgi:hypothetical protein